MRTSSSCREHCLVLKVTCLTLWHSKKIVLKWSACRRWRNERCLMVKSRRRRPTIHNYWIAVSLQVCCHVSSSTTLSLFNVCMSLRQVLIDSVRNRLSTQAVALIDVRERNVWSVETHFINTKTKKMKGFMLEPTLWDMTHVSKYSAFS